MRLVVDTHHTTATGTFGRVTADLVTRLEGRKVWKHSQCLRLETTEHNIRLFQELFAELDIYDLRPKTAVASRWDGQPGSQLSPSPSLAQPGSPAGEPSPGANPAHSGGQPLGFPDAMDERMASRVAATLAQPGDGGRAPSLTLQAQAGRLFAGGAAELAGAAKVNPALWLGDRPLREPAFHTEPYADQRDAFMKLRRLRVAALFSEPGTGKTKIAVDLICDKAVNFGLRNVVIFSWPKGVHHQWLDEQLPKHMWSLPHSKWAWEGKRLPDERTMAQQDIIKFFSFNIEAVNVDKVYAFVDDLLNREGERTMIVVDESQTIKNPSSVRTKKLYKLGVKAGFKMIMTGTPIARDITDEWSQFKFLDERIIGIRYKTAFQSQFCVLGGFKDKKVIAHRNLDVFSRLVHPYIFRATKEQLKLPPKVYDRIVFDLTPKQKDLQASLKETFIAQIKDGTITSVDSSAAMMLRLQQLACGYMVDDNGEIHDMSPNPRLEALQELCEQRTGKKIIWCRFQRDIKLIKEIYGKRAVVHYGPSTPAEREQAKSDFIKRSDIEFFLATPATAGTGVDGLQEVCSTAIYYSQSFNAIERWQSEERIHRIGTKSTTTYFDIIGRASIDVPIAANLRQKKSFSDFVLDDVRRMLDGI